MADSRVRLPCQVLANASLIYHCDAVKVLHDAFFREERWPIEEDRAAFDAQFQIYRANPAYVDGLARGLSEGQLEGRHVRKAVLNAAYASLQPPPRQRRVAPSRTGRPVAAADFAQLVPSRLTTSQMKTHRDVAHFQALVADYARASVLLGDLREKLTAAGPTGTVSLKNFLSDKETAALGKALSAQEKWGSNRKRVESLVAALGPRVELLRRRAAR